MKNTIKMSNLTLVIPAISAIVEKHVSHKHKKYPGLAITTQNETIEIPCLSEEVRQECYNEILNLIESYHDKK